MLCSTDERRDLGKYFRSWVRCRWRGLYRKRPGAGGEEENRAFTLGKAAWGARR